MLERILDLEKSSIQMAWGPFRNCRNVYSVCLIVVLFESALLHGMQGEKSYVTRVEQHFANIPIMLK